MDLARRVPRDQRTVSFFTVTTTWRTDDAGPGSKAQTTPRSHAATSTGAATAAALRARIRAGDGRGARQQSVPRRECVVREQDAAHGRHVDARRAGSARYGRAGA